MGYAAAAGGVLSLIGGIIAAPDKVVVPDFKRVDQSAEQGNAIKGNLANFDSASALAAKASGADQDVLLGQLRKAIPGYDQIVSQISKNIQNQTQGNIAPEVADAWNRSSAAKAFSSGVGVNSGAGRNLVARDFGLNTMQVQQQGLQNGLNFIQSQRQAAVAPTMSVTSMFLSPQQRIGLLAQENQSQFTRDLMAAQVAAQADPMMAAIGNGLQQIGGGLMGGGFNQMFSQGSKQKSDGGLGYTPGWNGA
jgi:hypothetical protein